MKHLSSRWAAASLLLPVILVIGLLLSGGRAPEAATSTTKGTVEVAFEGTINLVDANNQPIGSPVAKVFQRLFLNVVSIRLNPSSDPNVSEFDRRWVSILVPAGVGMQNPGPEVTTAFTGFGNFGPSGNAISLGQGRSEIQLDLNALQNGPEIFNSAQIPAKTYQQVELVLDPKTQGSAVPLCASSGPAGEGCVTYPAIFSPPNGSLTTIRGAGKIDITRGSFQTLLINITVNVGPAPTSTANGGNPSSNSVALESISIDANPPVPPQPAPGLGSVSGTVKGATKRTRIVAELSGTNQIVASTGVTNGKYSMSLPALPQASGSQNCDGIGDNGTLYDIYTTGSGEYDVHSGIPICAGAVPGTTVNLTIKSSGARAISGTIFDGCNSGLKIPSATLVLYEPDSQYKSVDSCAFDSLGNVIAIPPPAGGLPPGTGCVAVATAQSDATGAFPMPGNRAARAPFLNVPVKVPNNSSGNPVDYGLKVTASGYDGLGIPVTANGKSLTCSGLTTKNTCGTISLEHGQLRTTVTLDSPIPGGASVLVMAEDHSPGTGLLNFQGVGMVSIPPGGTTNSATMNIPDDGLSGGTICDGSAATTPCTFGVLPLLDVFGQVQDSYFGVPQSATGHAIEVSSNITGSPQCSSAPAATTLSGFGCAGHGSIAGSIANSDPYSTVVLSKGGVNLMQSGVAPLIPSTNPNLTSGSAFSFCVPGSDTYALQHFEDLPNAAPSPVPGGGPIDVDVPAPVATSTAGCHTICSSATGECLFCNGTVLTPPIN